MIQIKPGVSIIGIKPEMVLAISAIERVCADYDVWCTLTSATEADAPHRDDSLHWTGYAVDVRTRAIPAFNRQKFRDDVAKALGNEFDVILESSHLHCEFQP